MRTRRAAVALALLGVLGLVVSAAALWPRPTPAPDVRGSGPGPAAVSPTPAPAVRDGASRGGEVPDVGRSVARPAAASDISTGAPVRVRIGAVGLNAPVRPVGVADDGQMQLPPDPRVLGWYRFGPAPQADDGGSIVIAGHLDSNRFGLGPLVRLRDLQPGDRIDVRVRGGRAVVYEVRDLRRFDRQALPASIFARSGPELLRLVTCGGAYDADAGGYQKNLVVTAVPV